MCMILKPEVVYKVLRPDYKSPVIETQWPRKGRMDSGRWGGLTLTEVKDGAVYGGLHFYRSFGACELDKDKIIVACQTTSVFASRDNKCVALDCEVGCPVYGQWLIDLYTRYDIRSTGYGRVNYGGMNIRLNTLFEKYLTHHLGEWKTHKRSVESGAWRYHEV